MTSRAAQYFRLAELLTGGCIGVLPVAVAALLMDIRALPAVLSYGVLLGGVMVAVWVTLGLFLRR